MQLKMLNLIKYWLCTFFLLCRSDGQLKRASADHARGHTFLPSQRGRSHGDHIMLPSIYAPVAGRCTVSGTRSIALYELFNCHLRFNCSRKLNHFDEYFQCHQYLIPYIVWKLCGRAAIFDKHPMYNILSGLIIFLLFYNYGNLCRKKAYATV